MRGWVWVLSLVGACIVRVREHVLTLKGLHKPACGQHACCYRCSTRALARHPEGRLRRLTHLTLLALPCPAQPINRHPSTTAAEASAWVALDEQARLAFPSRHHRLLLPIRSSGPGSVLASRRFRLRVVCVANPAAANSVQLACLDLYGSQAQKEAQAPAGVAAEQQQVEAQPQADSAAEEQQEQPQEQAQAAAEQQQAQQEQPQKQPQADSAAGQQQAKEQPQPENPWAQLFAQ